MTASCPLPPSAVTLFSLFLLLFKKLHQRSDRSTQLPAIALHVYSPGS